LDGRPGADGHVHVLSGLATQADAEAFFKHD
jgi:hypothetical protein